MVITVAVKVIGQTSACKPSFTVELEGANEKEKSPVPRIKVLFAFPVKIVRVFPTGDAVDEAEYANQRHP